MKKKSKINLILMILGINFALSPIFGNIITLKAGSSNKISKYDESINLNNENVKLSYKSKRISLNNIIIILLWLKLWESIGVRILIRTFLLLNI